MLKAWAMSRWIRQEIRLTPGFGRIAGKKRVGNQPAAHFQLAAKAGRFRGCPRRLPCRYRNFRAEHEDHIAGGSGLRIESGRGQVRLPCGGCLGQILPMRAPHGVIESGQNDRAVGQLRHGSNQPGGRGPRSGRSCNDDRPVGRRCGHASGEDVEHRIVMTRRAGTVDFLKQRRPVLARDLEKLRVSCHHCCRSSDDDIVEAGEITFLGLDRLDEIEQAATQPDGIGRIGRGNQRHAAEMIQTFCGAMPFSRPAPDRPRRSVAAVCGIGGSSARVAGSAESKKPASSSVSPRGRIDGRIADPLPIRSVSSERSARAALRVGTKPWRGPAKRIFRLVGKAGNQPAIDDFLGQNGRSGARNRHAAAGSGDWFGRWTGSWMLNRRDRRRMAASASPIASGVPTVNQWPCIGDRTGASASSRIKTAVERKASLGDVLENARMKDDGAGIDHRIARTP
jgi:hypothetical protein